MKSEKLQSKIKNWQKVKIKNIGKIITGKTPSTLDSTNFGGPYPFITIPDLKYQKYISNTERTISEKGAKLMKNLKLPPWAIMVSCLATVGELGITVQESFTNQQINSVICNENKVIPEFLYYCFKYNKPRLLKYSGSVYTNISKSKFENFEIEIPPDINEQRRIADILSAFDDKIELNNKINKTLEEIAQAIFKEWFVNFKFPGHEKVKIVDSELGKIPEGWEVKNLKEVSNIISRGPSLKYVTNPREGIPVLNQRCIRNGEIFLEAIQYAEPVKKIFFLQLYDILINSMGTGTLGRVSRNLSIDYPMIIHNCITFVRTKNQFLQLYLYYQIKSQEKYFEQLAIGSTGQQSLPLDVIKKIRILLPPLNILETFYKKIDSIWKLIGRNKKENQKLAELRDLLLPKLMSPPREIKI